MTDWCLLQCQLNFSRSFPTRTDTHYKEGEEEGDKWMQQRMCAAEREREKKRGQEEEINLSLVLGRTACACVCVCVRMEGLCAAYVYGTWSFPQRRQFSGVNRRSFFEVSRTLKVSCTRQSVSVYPPAWAAGHCWLSKTTQGCSGKSWMSLSVCETFFKIFSEWWHVSGFLSVNMVFSSGEGPGCQDQTATLFPK